MTTTEVASLPGPEKPEPAEQPTPIRADPPKHSFEPLPPAVILPPLPVGCPPYPTADDLLQILSLGTPLDPLEAQSIWVMLWKAFGEYRICTGFYERQGMFTGPVWREAIREIVRNGGKPGTIGYVEKPAAKIKAKGTAGKPDPPPSRPEPPRVLQMPAKTAEEIAEERALEERRRKWSEAHIAKVQEQRREMPPEARAVFESWMSKQIAGAN